MRTRKTSIADVLFASVAALVVLSIALVRVQHQRESARGATCANNLKQLLLATHNYHDTYRLLPMGTGGTSAVEDAEPWRNNADRLSPWVGLLPFCEELPLWEKISTPIQVGSITFPSMGPVPWYDPQVYTPWSLRPNIMVCPSDQHAAEHPTVASYVLCYGDAVHMVGGPYEKTAENEQKIRVTNRGLFAAKRPLRIRDCLDGLSNTLMYSEACIANQPVAKGVADLAFNPSLCLKASQDKNGKFWPAGREACWADGCLHSVGFQTILPPNSPSATSDTSDLEGIMSASSYHDGGVHVGYADGRVQFVLDSIDAGKPDTPTVANIGDGKVYSQPGAPSPYGLWGALGTRAGGEQIAPDENIIDPPRELSAFEREQLQAKPLQTWTAAVGAGTIQARQVDLQSESAVILLTEDGETKRVPLSRLRSEDAYRAVEQHLTEKMQARAALKTQLEEGLAMLDQRQFEQFAKTYMMGGDADPQGMANLIQLERGLYIHAFETALRNLAAPREVGVQFAEDDQGNLAVKFAEMNRPFLARLRFMYSQGRWQFHIH